MSEQEKIKKAESQKKVNSTAKKLESMVGKSKEEIRAHAQSVEANGKSEGQGDVEEQRQQILNELRWKRDIAEQHSMSKDDEVASHGYGELENYHKLILAVKNATDEQILKYVAGDKNALDEVGEADTEFSIDEERDEVLSKLNAALEDQYRALSESSPEMFGDSSYYIMEADARRLEDAIASIKKASTKEEITSAFEDMKGII